MNRNLLLFLITMLSMLASYSKAQSQDDVSEKSNRRIIIAGDTRSTFVNKESATIWE